METVILAVANEIRKQLGNKCLYMLGAKHIVGSENHLQFQIRGCRKISHIVITLNFATDLYKMEFIKMTKNFDRNVVAEYEGVYVSMLHNLIEKETGLYTSL